MVWFPDFCGSGCLRIIFQSFPQRFLTFSSEISTSLHDNFPLSVVKKSFSSLILLSVIFSGLTAVKNMHPVLYSLALTHMSVIWNFFVFLSNMNLRC